MAYSFKEEEKVPRLKLPINEMGHRLATDLAIRSILLKMNSDKANTLLCEQLKEQSLAITSSLADQAVAMIDKKMQEINEEFTIDECTRIMTQYSELHDVTLHILDGLFSPPKDVAGIY